MVIEMKLVQLSIIEFYDIELACIIQKVVKLINSEDWNMAKAILNKQ